MSDSWAASAGVVLAGVALVAAFLPWGASVAGFGAIESAVGGTLALVAVAAFSLRRHGLLDRGPSSVLAGAASLAVVGYALAVAVAAAARGGPVGLESGLGVAVLGGFGGVLAAYGDGRRVPRDRLLEAASATGAMGVVGCFGLVAIGVWTLVGVSVVDAFVPGDPTPMQQTAISAVSLGLGTGTVASVFLWTSDRTWSYVDFAIPDRRDVGYVLVGVVGLLVVLQVLSLAFAQFGVETADHSIEQTAQGNPSILLIMIPASWLIIGPGEELLYRNVVQKTLYDAFSERTAVVVASAIFALVHILAYAANATPVQTLITLVVIFFLSLILGTTYLRTGNLTVSAMIHGTYDALLFAAMYVRFA